MKALAIAIALAGASACAGELENPERFAACPPGDVEQLFQQRCGDCHGATEPEAMLDLVSPGVADRLIGVPSGTALCEGWTLIEPSTGQHLLLDKLGDSSCGSRMPLALNEFSAIETECVRRWVDDAIASAGASP